MNTQTHMYIGDTREVLVYSKTRLEDDQVSSDVRRIIAIHCPKDILIVKNYKKKDAS